MKITAAITGVECYLPEDRLTNKDLEKMVDTSDEWIMTRCGVSERRILKDKTKASSFMAAEAASRLLAKKFIAPEEIELIILATVTPDHIFPASAAIVADKIGARNAWAFDLQAACSSFLYALQTASRFIETGVHKKILVIGADKMSSIIDYSDRKTSILFGDAAGAVLLEPSTEGLGILDARLYSDGSGKSALYQVAGGSLNPPTLDTVINKQHYVHMDGQAVFKFAVTRMADVAEEMMKRNNLRPEDIAYLCPHQANKRIIQATAERMGIGMDKVMINIHKYGNTTSASMPLCMWEWEKNMKKGDNIVLTTFGAGFSWGGIYLKWAY